jgi:MPBQ/MSBQ methyltransferase
MPESARPASPGAAHALPGLTADDLAAIDRYLHSVYQGVYVKGEIARHVRDYAGLALAEEQVAEVRQVDPATRTVLDVGCGFGAFVLAARQAGLDAWGVDVSPFEIGIAARRLQRLGDPRPAYVRASGAVLPFRDASFDAVTLWNVLEHVPDCRPLLREAARVVRPGGAVHIRCPNYAAVRTEPHYYVLWPSLIPRKLALAYLRWRGRNPRFFAEHVFYRTNREVLGVLADIGLRVSFPSLAKLDRLDEIRNPRIRMLLRVLGPTRSSGLIRRLAAAACRNPFKAVVAITASRRPEPAEGR